MTHNKAREILSFHSYQNQSLNDPRLQTGFIGNLIPKNKTLTPDNFHEIIECIFILHNELQESFVYKDLLSNILNIIYYSRSLGLNKDSSLSQPNQKQLEEWLEIFSSIICCLLDGSDLESSFTLYQLYYPDEFNRLFND